MHEQSPPPPPSTTDAGGYNGDWTRGAPLGRPSRRPAGGEPVTLRIAPITLDKGGYDPGGAYWGTGGWLWEAWDDTSETYLTGRVMPADRHTAFERRGGVPIGEPGHDAFAARYDWTAHGNHYTAADQIREILGQGVTFHPFGEAGAGEGEGNAT